MGSQVVNVILAYGLLGIAILAFAEKFLPMFPSSAFLLFVGMHTTSHPLHFIAALFATVLGSTIGALAWYAIGRSSSTGVQKFIEKFGRYFALNQSRYDRLLELYQKNAFWTTAIGQVIPTARVYIGLPAGAAKIRLGAFLLATLLGVAIWNTSFLFFGLLLQSNR